jgi:uncharacterized repeat protein (TIGR03803 family)
MKKSLARSAMASAFVFLFVLVAAAGAQSYSVLTTVGGTPYATPLIDSSGNVFGTTPSGGAEFDCGVVYELVNNGGGSYTNNTLYTFTCENDGGDPLGGVVMDSAGNLYGTAYGEFGGGYGVVYELMNQGGGSYTFEVIYAFTSNKTGRHPLGDLAMFKGSLYGVTYKGGGGCIGDCGTVYRLTKSGGKWVETVLHVFNDRGDGYYPSAGVVLDREGNIYGTTYKGGRFGYGTVFRLTPQGSSPDAPQSSDSYKETILHSFNGEDGCDITSGVVFDSVGSLYGTAAACDYNDTGTVYRLKRSGSKYAFKVIFTFNRKNGSDPSDEPGHLALDSAGNIYGTAQNGGGYGFGTVFKLAAGSFLYTDLHDFDKNGMDGYWPQGGVSLDSLGNLYGTTLDGGSNGGYGTVWQISNP